MLLTLPFCFNYTLVVGATKIMERISIEQMPEVKTENQKHLIRYVNFINSRPERDLKKDGYGYNIHHIVPKSLGGIENSSNKIKLTDREHYISHLILWKCGYKEMTYAFRYMSINHRFPKTLTSRQFQKLHLDLCSLVSINISSIENKYKYCRNITNGLVNKRLLKDAILPEGFWYGRLVRNDINSIRITNGCDETAIKKTDKIPVGWYIGRKNPSTKGTIWYTNGAINRMIKTFDEIPTGFYKGKTTKTYKKRNSSPIKGKVAISNGYHNAYILKTDLIPDGYTLVKKKIK